MARIQLPNQALGAFVKAANSWLSRTADQKAGLEIRFANQNGRLHVSVGADANYIEAILKCDEADIQNLVEPIFLDVSQLASYHFKSDKLAMVIPQGEKEDQRVQFITPGLNFRVPRKQGEIWRRNFFDLSQQGKMDFILDKEAFDLFRQHMVLPDSFKARTELQITIDVFPGEGFHVYGMDVGAFWHRFKKADVRGEAGQLSFVEDFFVPCKQFEVETEIGFGMDERQCFAEFTSPAMGIELLRWTKPKFQKRAPAIPQVIEKLREIEVSRLMAQTGVLTRAIDDACMFLTPTEMRSVPLAVSVVAHQFSFTTKKPSGEGEVTIEGDLKEDATTNVKMHLQAACFRDYLGEFDKAQDVKLQVLKKTLLMEQELERVTLLYWMPRVPGIGES